MHLFLRHLQLKIQFFMSFPLQIRRQTFSVTFFPKGDENIKWSPYLRKWPHRRWSRLARRCCSLNGGRYKNCSTSDWILLPILRPKTQCNDDSVEDVFSTDLLPRVWSHCTQKQKTSAGLVAEAKATFDVDSEWHVLNWNLLWRRPSFFEQTERKGTGKSDPFLQKSKRAKEHSKFRFVSERSVQFFFFQECKPNSILISTSRWELHQQQLSTLNFTRLHWFKIHKRKVVVSTVHHDE